MTEWTLRSAYGPDQIIVRATSIWGGAIFSIWRYRPDGTHTEFLDSHDCGRLLQTALQYDHTGEGNNPTEGGSALDPPMGPSSSEILVQHVQGQVLTGISRMANWLPVDGVVLSDTYLGKTYELGWRGFGNVLHARIVIIPGSEHFDAGVEIVTAYLPPEFSVVRAYAPESVEWYTDVHWNAASPPFAWSDHAAKDAIVAATVDGKHAIGIWSPYAAGHYAVNYGETMKLDAWDTRDPVAGVPMVYEDVFVVIGDLCTVKATLHDVYELWRAG